MRKLVVPALCMVLLGGLIAGCEVTITSKTPTQETAAPVATTPPAPTATAKPHRTFSVGKAVRKKNKVQIPGPITFQTGTAVIDPASDPVLDVVKQFMDENPQVNILRVEGHTDSDGDDKANMDLSKARALAVTAWLVGKGVDCKRLLAVGFGETQPFVGDDGKPTPNDTPEHKAMNRRVEFIVASENGKPVKDDAGKDLPIDGGGQGQNAGKVCP
jgi:OOP family OmpA-OmpF porin